MSPDAQRIAIAEACGWKSIGREKNLPLYGWISPGPLEEIPDYLNDLNAMHEAEKILTGDDYYKYSCHIYEAACKTQKKTGQWRFIGATAAQRAEAFLRTIGMWEDSQQGNADYATAAQRTEAYLKTIGKWKDDK